MRSLQVTATARIDAPVEIVRQQFADVAHHAVTGLHRGVRFDVIDDDGRTCRYHQISRVGPLRLRQELRLERTVAGPLVNTITAGQFAGGTITFEITTFEITTCENATFDITGDDMTGNAEIPTDELPTDEIPTDELGTDEHSTNPSACVTATLEAPVRAPQRFAAPILRRTVRRALLRALEEDRVDLESGRYTTTTAA